jgi:hypothetical protein
MGNLRDFAERELAAAKADESLYGDYLPKAVLELIDCFAAQGHSGMSANVTIQLFTQLARFEPLGPLTGEDDEWNEVSDGLFQNRRCGHVFKENGQAYDNEGRIFRESDGCCFTNGKSRVPITFPYTPKREYVDVPKED